MMYSLSELAAKYEPFTVVSIRLNTPSSATSSSLDTVTLDQALHHGGKPLAAMQHALKAADENQRQQFVAGVSVEQLVPERAQAVDELIKRAYHLHLSQFQSKLSLVAVGGYGRGELHPHSDVDLLMLLPTGNPAHFHHAIERFIAFLWDLGLPASHSVRTLEECALEAQADVTVATNLMEIRHLAGATDLFADLQRRMQPEKLWPTNEFFLAKLKEQQQRHAKYHDTAYRLEPNIKEGPGGLRDIQMIGWVAKRHFNANNLHSLLEHRFLTADEYRNLQHGQAFLWRVRFALHLLYGRREDRLLFDAQPRLATQFDYRDMPASLAVEQFMQKYYRTIKELSLLNEMLLQLLEEAILSAQTQTFTPLTAEFEERNGFLHASDVGLFARQPSMLLKLFHMLEQHPRLKGVGAGTLRSLRANLHKIDDAFRAEPTNRALFMQILHEPLGVTHELRRMNRYGVLGRYLPAFGKIEGRMQYDLFHTYTVDEHILFVVGNLRRFALSRYDSEFPLCSQIMQALPKPELVYLGALFHDIGKGRGGDHSELGAQDAEAFCLDHGLSHYDARLVAWLVQYHLLLSLTAQKKDINDPQVVHDFACKVGDQTHLDFLYVLTVADVRGTNPELWNSWKASLFKELYQNASRALRHGLENPIDKDELIGEIQERALALLHELGIGSQAAREVWNAFSEEYFLRHTVEEIVWHTHGLRGRQVDGAPLVLLRQQTTRGGTVVSVYSNRDELVFGRVTAALAELGLTILDARLIPMTSGYRLDTYVVLEDNHEPIAEAERLAEIEQVLRREVARRHSPPIAVTRRAPRQVRLFTTPTEMQFTDDPVNQRTVLEISAGDQPGLLSLIGQVLRQCEIRLQNAKITTVGERAEDVFFITDAHDQPLTDPAAREGLRTALLAHIGETA
ncbi:MAG: [protein-PII] uridylyltransferase [Gammaproteobacteria bacterium]